MAYIYFNYGAFYSVPREIQFHWNDRDFEMVSYFDHDPNIDDYSEHYVLYLIAEIAIPDRMIPTFMSEDDLRDRIFIGKIPVAKVQFDKSLRSYFDSCAIEECVQASQYNRNILKGHTQSSNSEVPSVIREDADRILAWSIAVSRPARLFLHIEGQYVMLESPLRDNGWSFEACYAVYILLPTTPDCLTCGAVNRQYIGCVRSDKVRFDSTHRLFARCDELAELVDDASSGRATAQTNGRHLSDAACARVPENLVRTFRNLDGEVEEIRRDVIGANRNLLFTVVETFDPPGRQSGFDIIEYDALERIQSRLSFSSESKSLSRWQYSYSCGDSMGKVEAVLYDQSGNHRMTL